MTFIDSFMKESNGATLEAKLYKEGSTYSVSYVVNGDEVKNEKYPGKSIHFVEDAASNWLNNIKPLNG